MNSSFTMIKSNNSSLFLIERNHNGFCNRIIHLIQDLMSSNETSDIKFKRLCADLPNIAILTKSATPGEVQMSFCHMIIVNNSHRETITTFSLMVSPKFITDVEIDTKRAFTRADDKIRFPTTEVLLCATAGDLVRSKKPHNWVTINAVLLLSLITKAVILDGQAYATEFFKFFSSRIAEYQTETSKLSESKGGESGINKDKMDVNKQEKYFTTSK